MKKVYYLLIILIGSFAFFGSFQNSSKIDKKEYYSPATDAGFESEALYRCVLDTLGEDKTTATDQELSQITEVICRNSKIESTKGIEKLTSLRYLNLYDNEVTSIDLSNNTNLVMLNMTFNKLNSIDLSDNTNLQQLYLNGNNLSSIDLSKNTKLIDLNVYNNNLNSINLTMLPELKFILLSLNNLSSIDLSNNNKLEHVYLSGNRLSEVKMPTNALNLTRLDLNYNQLSSINLSTVPKLNYLITSANKLTNLDVSKNSELEYLYSSSNKISNINLSNNTKLIDLDLYNNQLSTIDLAKQNSLKYLNVSLNKLNNLDLSNNPNLEKLYASSNNLTALSLDKQTNLKEINAVFNKLNGYNIPNKSKITYMVVEYDWLKNMNLSEYSNLEKLDIDHYKKIATPNDSIAIVDVIKHIPSGITLNKYEVYDSFENINSKSVSICKYDVNYIVSGTNSTTETTNVNVCTNEDFDKSTFTANDGNRLQIYSTDLKIANLNTSASLQFDGYYEILFNTEVEEVVKVPNTAAVASIFTVLFGLVAVITGTIIITRRIYKKEQQITQ